MKAVLSEVPQTLLKARKRTGADLWDEKWEGVLHMPAMPLIEHQDLAGELQSWLRKYWARPRRAKVYFQVNVAPVGGWPDDFRIPDLLLLTKKRYGIRKGKYFEGAADVVIEIHSPGDESFDKLPFYADLGVPEVWIIHRDTKEPEVFLLKRGRYVPQTVSGGWMRSPSTGVEMRATRARKLAVRMDGDDATLEELPEE